MDSKPKHPIHTARGKLVLDGVPEVVSDFVYEVSEFRSLLRASGYYTEADEERVYLDDMGVKVTDIDSQTTRYEFRGYTWKIHIT